MLFLAKETSKSLPASMAFKQRNLNLAQARVSELVCTAKPTQTQIAYSGYKDNLEAFLFATATQRKVTTEGSVYSIPDSWVPKLPLAYPRVIVRFARQQTPEMIRLFEEKMAEFGTLKVAVGKGPSSYTIERPTMKILQEILPTVCSPTGAYVDGHAQLNAAKAILPVYRCIDLFLATNTYDYKLPSLEYPANDKGGSVFTAPSAQNSIGVLTEFRIPDSNYWRDGFNDKGPARKRSRIPDKGGKKKFHKDEPDDITPALATQAVAEDIVLVAKPSPLPSSYNFGSPEDVPEKHGLVFPYFNGMMASDSAGLRELISDLFFRNLGDSDNIPKAAFQDLRSNIGTVANTPEGVQLGHVLYGVKLALETQTILFLLFDGSRYLGFCLLGEHFSILLHGKWHEPLSPDELAEELATMKTHDQTLKDLADRIKRCKLSSAGEGMDIDIELHTCTDVANALSRIEFPEGDDAKGHEKDEEEVAAILARLNFRPQYLTFKPDNIARSIRYLLEDEPVPADLHFWIPLKAWRNIGTKEYRIFAQYGPRSFSLRNSKGDELLIPKVATEADPMTEMEDGKPKYPKFLVGEKPVAQCMTDWRALVETGKMRMDYKERAAGSRNHVMSRDVFAGIWEALKKGAVDGKLRVKGTSDNAAKKRKADDAFGKGEISAALFNF